MKHILNTITKPFGFTFAAIALFLFMGFSAGTKITSYGALRLIPHVQSYYELNYHTEFLKRGLVGHLFSFLSIPPNAWAIGVIASISICIISIIIVELVNLSFVNTPKIKPYLLGLFLISPATFMHFGFDFGRFDLINYALLLFVLRQILTKPTNTHYLVSLLIPLGILIHETFIFIHLPLLLMTAAWLAKTHQKKHYVALGITQLALAVSTFLIVFIFGGIDQLPPTAFAAFQHISFQPIQENILYTMADLKANLSPIYLVILLIGYIGINTAIYYQLFKKYPLAWLPVIGILPLFIIGVDIYRWTAHLVFNMMLVIPIGALLTKSDQDGPNLTFLRGQKPLPILLIGLSILGPLGVHKKVFPMAKKIIENLL